MAALIISILSLFLSVFSLPKVLNYLLERKLKELQVRATVELQGVLDSGSPVEPELGKPKPRYTDQWGMNG